MALYRVMGRGETNEERCFQDDMSRDEAVLWITENQDNYPETQFWYEEQVAYLDWSGHPDYDDESGEFVD